MLNLGFLLGAVALTLIAPTLGGCDLARNQLKPDRSGNLEMQDYRDALAERQPELDVSGFESGASGAPEFKPYVANNLEQVKPMPLVSISVNQTVPLRDVLFELADQADYDLELDPNIRGSIIYTARERPLLTLSLILRACAINSKTMCCAWNWTSHITKLIKLTI